MKTILCIVMSVHWSLTERGHFARRIAEQKNGKKGKKMNYLLLIKINLINIGLSLFAIILSIINLIRRR